MRMHRRALVLAIGLLLGSVRVTTAAVAIVQHVVGQSTASANTLAVTVGSTGAGRLIVVAAAIAQDRTVTGVTDGTTAFTQFPAVRGVLTAFADYTDVWYLLSSNTGKTSVTITWSGAAGTFLKVGFVYEVSGFTTAATDVGGHVDDQAAVASLQNGASVTTTSTTGFVLGVIVNQNGTINNPHTGNEFTSGGDIESTVGFWAACALISSTAAGHQPAWDGNGATDPYAASTVSFKEASAAVSAPRLLLRGVGP